MKPVKDGATPRPLKANINQDIIKNCKCLACGSTTIAVEFHPEIVRAVNAHDELVSLLKETFEGYIKPFHKDETINGLWFRIEQALSKVKEVSHD